MILFHLPTLLKIPGNILTPGFTVQLFVVSDTNTAFN